ncbi:MAG TPA: response regulator [Anaerolineaceae bacterium]
MTRMLLADDDADLLEFLKEELIRAGFQVTSVTNGADAIIAAVEQNFDLILLDMMMPGLDGIKVIRVLQKVIPNVPIIGLTGYVGRGYMSQAMSLGVTILTKPIAIPDLLQEVNQVLFTKK